MNGGNMPPLHEGDFVPHSATFQDCLVSAKEAAHCLNLPVYLLSQPKERKRLGIPHYRVGKMVRFKVQELMNWLVAQTEERERQQEKRQESAQKSAQALARSHATSLGKEGGVSHA